jgi:hypothetical protein
MGENIHFSLFNMEKCKMQKHSTKGVLLLYKVYLIIGLCGQAFHV